MELRNLKQSPSQNCYQAEFPTRGITVDFARCFNGYLNLSKVSIGKYCPVAKIKLIEITRTIGKFCQNETPPIELALMQALLISTRIRDLPEPKRST